jgi:hypothetical protein
MNYIVVDIETGSPGHANVLQTQMQIVKEDKEIRVFTSCLSETYNTKGKFC